MKLIGKIKLLAIVITFTTNYALAQQKSNQGSSDKTMKTYLIERNIPGASSLTAEQLKGISQTSCSVLKEMGPTIEWIHSYVAGDKVYCLYKAENVELIKEHAKKGEFPANVITEVAAKISPATAEN